MAFFKWWSRSLDNSYYFYGSIEKGVNMGDFKNTVTGTVYIHRREKKLIKSVFGGVAWLPVTVQKRP